MVIFTLLNFYLKFTVTIYYSYHLKTKPIEKFNYIMYYFDLDIFFMLYKLLKYFFINY